MKYLVAILLLCSSSWAAISFTAVGPSGVGTAQTTSFQSGLATVTAGNAIVIGISVDVSTIAMVTVTTTAGDTATFQGAITSGNVREELWTVASAIGGSCRITATFVGTATDISIISGTYSGVVAFGNVSTASGATVSSLTQTLTTQDANNFIVGMFGSDGTSAWNSTFNTGTFRQRLSQSGAMPCFGDNTVASAGSVSVKNTLSAGTPNVAGVAIELRTSGGGGGSTVPPTQMLTGVGV